MKIKKSVRIPKIELSSFRFNYPTITLFILVAYFYPLIGWTILLLSLSGGIYGYINFRNNYGYNRFLYMPGYKIDKVTGKYVPVILYDEKKRKEIFSWDVQCDNPDAAIREAYGLAENMNESKLPDGSRRV